MLPMVPMPLDRLTTDSPLSHGLPERLHPWRMGRPGPLCTAHSARGGALRTSPVTVRAGERWGRLREDLERSGANAAGGGPTFPPAAEASCVRTADCGCRGSSLNAAETTTPIAVMNAKSAKQPAAARQAVPSINRMLAWPISDWSSRALRIPMKADSCSD
jgi:hypothetical protein